MEAPSTAIPDTRPSSGRVRKGQHGVYFGNLAAGLVGPEVLRELCNGALAPLCPDAAAHPPVVSVAMGEEGKCAFVELRTEELARSALLLDQVELCGQCIHATRAQVSSCLRLENMATVAQLQDDEERREIAEEVKEECGRYGAVAAVRVPKPPLRERGRPLLREPRSRRRAPKFVPALVFIQFVHRGDAITAQRALNGRTFAGRTVVTRFVPEEEFPPET